MNILIGIFVLVVIIVLGKRVVSYYQEQRNLVKIEKAWKEINATMRSEAAKAKAAYQDHEKVVKKAKKKVAKKKTK